jgi:hypothetical protein
METLVDPDPEDTIRKALTFILGDMYGEPVEVSTRRHDGRFVRVRASGGQGRVSRVLAPFQIILESYGDDETEASLLGRRAAAAIWELEGTSQQGVTIAGITQASALQNLPDPDTSQIRYSQLFVVRMKAAAV